MHVRTYLSAKTEEAPSDDAELAMYESSFVGKFPGSNSLPPDLTAELHTQWKSTRVWVRILCCSTDQKHARTCFFGLEDFMTCGFSNHNWMNNIQKPSNTINNHGFSCMCASSKALVGSSNTKHAGAVAIASRLNDQSRIHSGHPLSARRWQTSSAGFRLRRVRTTA